MTDKAGLYPKVPSHACRLCSSRLSPGSGGKCVSSVQLKIEKIQLSESLSGLPACKLQERPEKVKNGGQRRSVHNVLEAKGRSVLENGRGWKEASACA